MSSTLQTVISVKNVGVRYSLRSGVGRAKDYWALRDVSFDLFHGESLGVIGKNGAGKSTLLRLLAGTISPDLGTITNYGYQVSLLSLNLGFLPYLTGRENAVLGGMFQGVGRKIIEEKMNEIIAFAELDEFIDQPLYTYSSGMQARLGFAVAFQIDPDVLLVDEVIGVGDQEFQRKSADHMKKRMRSNDSTIVVVSHNASLLKEVTDRAVWIEDHVVQAEGKTEEVLELYSNYLETAKKIRTV